MKQTQVYRPAVDWAELAEELDRPQLPAPRKNFVPPTTPKIEMPAVQLAGTAQAPVIVPSAIVTSETKGSHDDRARAWLRYSLPLCAAFGLVVLVLLAVATPLFRAGLGVMFLRAVGVYFGAFLLAYVPLVMHYWGQSPEGRAKADSRELWRFLGREQAHRQQIEMEAWELSKAEYQRRLECDR